MILYYGTKIPIKHVKNVCKIGQGKDCCRYLIASQNGLECARHEPIRHELNERALLGLMVAQGSNCNGEIGGIKIEPN